SGKAFRPSISAEISALTFWSTEPTARYVQAKSAYCSQTVTLGDTLTSCPRPGMTAPEGATSSACSVLIVSWASPESKLVSTRPVAKISNTKWDYRCAAVRLSYWIGMSCSTSVGVLHSAPDCRCESLTDSL